MIQLPTATEEAMERGLLPEPEVTSSSLCSIIKGKLTTRALRMAIMQLLGRDSRPLRTGKYVVVTAQEPNIGKDEPIRKQCHFVYLATGRDVDETLVFGRTIHDIAVLAIRLETPSSD